MEISKLTLVVKCMLCNLRVVCINLIVSKEFAFILIRV